MTHLVIRKHVCQSADEKRGRVISMMPPVIRRRKNLHVAWRNLLPTSMKGISIRKRATKSQKLSSVVSQKQAILIQWNATKRGER